MPGEESDLGRTQSEARNVIKVEILQLVRAYLRLGALDLALLVGADQSWLSTVGFLDKIDDNLRKAMADRTAA